LWGETFSNFVLQATVALRASLPTPSLSPLDQLSRIVSNPKRRIRVGYISPDFFTHSVSYFIECMLRYHNRQLFEIFCYSNVSSIDTRTDLLKSLSDHWREVLGLGPLEAAQKIREDEIDVLVELAGHTAGNRLDVMVLQPAPVQVRREIVFGFILC
jgi:predicted O-linked N-acetylglucosamine transferase (SPINDLY family)